MITDMNPNQLLELVEIVQPIGVFNSSMMGSPVVEGSSGSPLTLRPRKALLAALCGRCYGRCAGAAPTKTVNDGST